MWLFYYKWEEEIENLKKCNISKQKKLRVPKPTKALKTLWFLAHEHAWCGVTSHFWNAKPTSFIVIFKFHMEGCWTVALREVLKDTKTDKTGIKKIGSVYDKGTKVLD